MFTISLKSFSLSKWNLFSFNREVSSLEVDRALLVQQQYELLNCLLTGSSAPTAIAEAQLHACVSALVRKRRRGVANSMPEVERALGKDFDLEFANFIREFPSVHPEGPGSDAANFHCYLQRKRKVAPQNFLCSFFYWIRRTWQNLCSAR